MGGFGRRRDESISKSDREYIIKKYKYQCAYCGKKGDKTHGPDGATWQIDHIIPYSWEGATERGNFALACRRIAIVRSMISGGSLMPKPCTICEDPRRDEFDRRARIEDNIAKIAQDFALSYDAFYRHVKANHHIREVTAIPTSAELLTSEEIYKEIEGWHAEAKDLQQPQKRTVISRLLFSGLKRLLKCLELMLKIHGQLPEGPQITIINNPEWVELRTLIIGALGLSRSTRGRGPCNHNLKAALDPVIWSRKHWIWSPIPGRRKSYGAIRRGSCWCSRQSGKSTITSALALHTATFCPNSLVLCLSPTLRQSSELFRNVSRFYGVDPSIPSRSETP